MEKKLNFKQDINYGVVSGVVFKDPLLSSVNGKLFWTITLKVRRDAKKDDIVKVVIPKDLMKGFLAPKKGKFYKFGGKVEGFFRQSNGKQRQEVRLRADMVKPLENGANKADVNQVLLTGTLCRETASKTTPDGTLLADNKLAVNGKYLGDSTYIPIRAIDGNAKIMKLGKIGKTACVRGCFGSRDYGTKDTGDHLEYFEITAKEFELLDMREYKQELSEESRTLSSKF